MSETGPEDPLGKDRYYHYFVGLSVGSWGACFLLILIPRIIVYLCNRPQKRSSGAPGKNTRTDQVLVEPSFYSSIQNWAEDLISGNTTTGRILVVFAFTCSMVSFVLYIINTHRWYGRTVELEIDWRDEINIQIDFALATFFVVYFFIRFLAADDKLMFIFTIESLVDFFTVPVVFLTVYLDTYWHGLRFLRALILLNLGDVLVYLRVINTSSAIRLTKLATIVTCTILTGAGICHLLENSGDPWRNHANSQELGYGDCLYYMWVTMSTVGYGDISCKTDLGKLFIALYMMGTIVMFAQFIPEIGRNLMDRPRYAGEYEPDGRQFIIVCGNINYETVTTFLADFFHPSRDDVDVEVIFLNKEEPNLEFEGLLKRESTRVQYFRGSMMNVLDLQRVRADQAAACLVVANKFCEGPDTEDASNIMRVISLKNFCEETRVIIQLMQYHNKSLLLNIPGWDWKRDDQAVCLNELKLGFIGQSCLAPGFSTLVSNLVIISNPNLMEELPKWKQEYFRCCQKFIMAETLSPTFVGMTFAQVAALCYTTLNLCLLAIEQRKYEGGDIFINPKEKVINPNAIGLFLTDSADACKRAWFYCRKCHANIKSEKAVTKCGCKRTAVRMAEIKDFRNASKHATKKRHNGADKFLKQQVEFVNDQMTRTDDFEDGQRPVRRKKQRQSQTEPDYNEPTAVEQSQMKYDSTGMYHWCPSRNINDCLMERQDAAMTILQDHVIVAVFAETDSPLIGLRNLVMPIRASNIHYKDLIHVVIVGNVDYLKKEWKMLQNLPKISVLNGSPLSRADLRAVKIDMCRMCVILSAKTPSRLEPVLADKEVLLTALNIKAMTFTGLDQEEFESETEEDEDEIKANGTAGGGSDSIMQQLMGGKRKFKKPTVTMIVDLAFASNVRFLDDHELYLDNVDLYRTLPFASGQALARGILDSLMSTTYFNASALRLIRSWVTGGATIELELALAEGAGLRGGYSTPDSLKRRDRFKMERIILKGSQFDHLATGGYTFGDLFGEAASKYEMLCIGLYRLKGADFGINSEEMDEDEREIRVVLTAPHKDLPLDEEDIAFMLVQYNNENDVLDSKKSS